MQIKTKKLLSLLFLGISFISYAQDISITGEIRPRTEMRRGYRSLINTTDDFALFTDQRSRINFKYASENITTYFVVQDVRTWGSQPQLIYNNEGTTTFHEAWAEAMLNKNFSLRLGRMELAYDDHRILGSVGWTQQARSHDLALLKYQDSTSQVHFGAAFNQDGPQSITTLYTVPKSYKAMQFLWYNKDLGTAKLSLLVLNNGRQVSSSSENYINYSQTLGGHLTKKMGDNDLTLFGYYQLGTDGDTNNTSINAFDFNIDIRHKFSDKLSASLGYEFLSGNSQVSNNSDNSAFNPLYGTNHKFNGFMDYFYVGNHSGSVGLQDVYAKLNYKLPKINLGLDAHFFMSAADILDQAQLLSSGNTTAASSFLGTELDLSVGTQLNKQAKVRAGFSTILGTESLEYLKGGDSSLFNSWGYVMVIFKPAFFSSTTAK